MFTKSAAAFFAFAALVSAPAFSETLNVPFTQYDTVTEGLYKGVVHVTVSGVGQASGANYSDAFYDYTEFATPENRGGAWELSYGLTALGPFGEGGIALSSAVIGGVPAYSPSHVYSFALDTGALTLSHLHFGIADDYLVDNSGAYKVTIAAPEPTTWVMLILGFGGLAGAAFAKRKAVAAA